MKVTVGILTDILSEIPPETDITEIASIQDGKSCLGLKILLEKREKGLAVHSLTNSTDNILPRGFVLKSFIWNEN